jgi:predicted TPR repeat methyltransferase
MNPSSELYDAYREAEALLAAGELRRAADLCKVMLDSNPEFSYGYHLMSSLFRATGTHARALEFAQIAVRMAPEVGEFHIQHGQILLSVGDWAGATAAFEAAYNVTQDDPIALLLWADACARQSDFEKAEMLFVRARGMENIPEMHEYEGLCMAMQGRVGEAETLFALLIAERPEYYPGHIHMGKLLMDHKFTVRAEACLARALRINPVAYDALYRMALLNEWQGQPDIAIRYAMQAIQISPQAWESHLLLGSLLLKQHHYKEAEQVLIQSHGVRPADAYALQLLVSAMCMQHKRDAVLLMLDRALALAPDNTVMRFVSAMLRGENPPAAPKEYVTTLFDGCAEEYDHHLHHMLDYRVPNAIFELVHSLPDYNSPTLSLLDIGCGTGLVAEALKGNTILRAGVDIADKMLDKARMKQLYTHLYSLDAIEFMLSSDRTFDLVVAADVLCYFGSLEQVMHAARNVVSTQGLLIFTIEKDESTPSFQLRNTGRYAHSPRYVRSLAADAGYVLVKEVDVALRMDHFTPVAGTLFAFRKAQLH